MRVRSISCRQVPRSVTVFCGNPALSLFRLCRDGALSWSTSARVSDSDPVAQLLPRLHELDICSRTHSLSSKARHWKSTAAESKASNTLPLVGKLTTKEATLLQGHRPPPATSDRVASAASRCRKFFLKAVSSVWPCASASTASRKPNFKGAAIYRLGE